MVNEGFSWFPVQASSFAAYVDYLYIFLVAISAAVSLAIAGTIIFFCIVYRRGSSANRVEHPHSHSIELAIEITWIVIPFVIFMAIFWWGAAVFFVQETPPADCMQISVVGKQWMWKFQHPSGRREINELHIPLNRPVKLTMISEDVIHDVYIPAFRTKHDVLPGQYTTEWFEATLIGEYHLFCAEYCGADHSLMKGRVVVMEPAAYEEWLKQTDPAQSPAVLGAQLFQQWNCAKCHAGSGLAENKAPSLVGLYDSEVKLNGGQTVKADDAYLRESILRPNAKAVAGYRAIMPAFEGSIGEDDLNNLMAYLKSLAGEPAPSAPAGK